MAGEVGYRFCPNDEELVNHFLKLKMLGHDDQVSRIPEIDVLTVEPWDIPSMMPNNSNDGVWYFFCRRNHNGQRLNRTTNVGFWKTIGKTLKIKDIATKQILVFYQNGANGRVRTNWIMHEYNPTFDFPVQSDYVLCKLRQMPEDNNL
ncbi:hypothetical protein JCGZ_23886 [Jatropha curcas]|uniref:NAC transcription factor 070 n=1 Tax=Jatropha curcas TaxID=180498 RepID=R4NEX0_JATCU|nr:NAC transcription factor 070 [Jatropha curcas]KDP42944.1 hypothetical protein JCGZ_23886 [Jatropha curcas]